MQGARQMVSGGIDIGTTSGWVRRLQATFALIFRLAVQHQQFEGFYRSRIWVGSCGRG